MVMMDMAMMTDGDINDDRDDGSSGDEDYNSDGCDSDNS